MRRFAILLPLLAAPGWTQVRYVEGAPINLCTVRGAQASGAPRLLGPAGLALHGVYGELRYQSNFGRCYWQLELPTAYQVSGLRTFHRNVITSLGYAVKTSLVPLDEAGWAAVEPAGRFDGSLGKCQDNCSQAYSQLEFLARAARFVRLEISGHNGAETGAKGVGHADLVLGKVQVWGPNNPETSPAISLAQSAWARGSCTLNDAQGNSGDGAALVDEMEPKAGGFGNVHVAFQARGSGVTAAARNEKPASFTVTLARRARIEAVAYASVVRTRTDRPRDLRVYTCAADIGNQWVLQRELKDIAGGEYEELTFDAPVVAKRVRFDVLRVWNTQEDRNSHWSFGHLAELYVFGTALPPDLVVDFPDDALTSGLLVDATGKPRRTLWQLQRYARGTRELYIDGLDDEFAPLPAGDYKLRIVSNAGEYRNIAAIGNSGQPPTPDGHTPTGIQSVCVGADGHVFSANGWDEAGHDWHEWSPTGATVRDAQYQIRNGHPNGLPYRLAVDDQYLYVAYLSHNDGGEAGSQWLQRFSRATGKAVPWSRGFDRWGLVQVYPLPKPKNWEQPISGLAVAGGVLFVGDQRANRIIRYDAATGEKLGEFAVDAPGALAADDSGRLWLVQAGGLAVLDGTGRVLARPLTESTRFGGLSLTSDRRLLLVDRDANRLRCYRLAGLTLAQRTDFGQPARPGDAQADHFYQLLDVAATPDGGFVTVQRLPLGGSRLTQWQAGGQVAWEQLGLEFTGNGAYPADKPDLFVSSYGHRYRLDRGQETWRFDGNLYTGGYIGDWHGAPRWVKLGGRDFFCEAVGDGFVAYRLDGDRLSFCAAVGGNWPNVKGERGENGKLGQWTWADVNGDGKVDDAEVNWFKQPGQGKYAHFGMNIDTAGNLIYCDQHPHSVWLLPLTGLNAAGNPVWDWAKAKEVLPRDTSPVKFDPLMAVRTETGAIYAFGRSTLYPPDPGSGPAWMAGWVLARFAPDGTREWVRRLPNHCPGMDYVPGDRGVMLGYFAQASVYHYRADGTLIGLLRPGAPAGGQSGWLDNTASIACNVDPRDGRIDVFAEEDYAHRILWYRADDSRVTVRDVPLRLP